MDKTAYTPRRIAAITMARNDDFFLNRWVRYYGEALGYEHLYIYLDGLEQAIPTRAIPEQVKCWEHRTLSRAQGDKYRIGLLSSLAQQLFAKGYDLVIGCDADEFLIVDPQREMGLVEYLSRQNLPSCASALGLDLGQCIGEEETLDSTRSILAQRHYAVLSSRYTKAVILARPLQWGSGFHRVKGHNYHILPDLYLVHTGYCDLKRLQLRTQDTQRTDASWEAHLKRRAKTIYYTTHRKAISADKILSRARRWQMLYRPLYALNKPKMPCPPRVVRLPSRFSQIEI